MTLQVRIVFASVAVLAVPLFAPSSAYSAPVLLAGIQVQSGGVPLNVDSPGLSAPTMADWNGDGKKDLVVGQFTGGNIWVFLNKGTDPNPVFDGGAKVLCGGVPLTTSYG